MDLIIDTTKKDQTKIILKNDKGSKIYNASSETALLSLIEQTLKDTNMTIQDIGKITVINQDGETFSRTRIGVVVANALAFALQKKVNGKEFVFANYKSEPSITKPKT